MLSDKSSVYCCVGFVQHGVDGQVHFGERCEVLHAQAAVGWWFEDCFGPGPEQVFDNARCVFERG